jgi:hypothetical protein
MTPETYQRLMDSLWKLAQGGLASLTVDRILTGIAADLEIEETEVRRLFPHRHHILLAMVEDLRRRVELPNQDHRLTPQDQIFDALMMYFEVAQPHRLTLKKLASDLIVAPRLLSQLLPPLYAVGDAIVDPYLSGREGVSAIRTLALNGVFIYAFHTFLEDETVDLSKTMATLDQALKTVTNWGILRN